MAVDPPPPPKKTFLIRAYFFEDNNNSFQEFNYKQILDFGQYLLFSLEGEHFND